MNHLKIMELLKKFLALKNEYKYESDFQRKEKIKAAMKDIQNKISEEAKK
jgi:hypothetical protein